MLKKLKKQLGIEDSDVNASVSEDVKAQLAVMQEQLAGKESELSNVVAKVVTLEAEKAALEQALATAIEHAQALEASTKEFADKQLADKLAVRKQLIVDIVGEAKADATFEAVKELEDGAFDTVVNALSLSIEKEAKSDMFTEKGVSAEADENKVTMTAEERILRQKFNIK